jgi:hypothetical protein
VDGTPVALLVAAGFVALVMVWHYTAHRQSGGRVYKPLWLAFTSSAVALLFVGAGFLGYNLSRHSRFIAGTAWSDTVIWWEVWTGLAATALAALFWRAGLRSIR